MDFYTTSNAAQNPGPASSTESSNIEPFKSEQQPEFDIGHPTSNTDIFSDPFMGDDGDLLIWPSDSQAVQIADLQKE